MSDAGLHVSSTSKARRKIILLTFTNFSLEVKTPGSLVTRMATSELLLHIVDEATDGVRLQWLICLSCSNRLLSGSD